MNVINTYTLAVMRKKENQAHQDLIKHCDRYPGRITPLRRKLSKRYLMINKYTCRLENEINMKLGYIKRHSFSKLPA